jgi:lysophospholipase L1-like esterase
MGCATTRVGAPAPSAEEEIVVGHFGDSTCKTDYLPAVERVDAVLHERLVAHYRQRITSLNLARARETTRQLLDGGRYARVRAVVPRLDVAFVRYGQNDLVRGTPEAFRADLEQLCDRLQADYPGIHLVLETNTFVDPAHGGSERGNARYDRFWEVTRTVARARGYPLVDVFARRRREVEAGNWDFSERSPRLALTHFGYYVHDDSRDAEMAGVPGWLGDPHPNARGVALTADEEFRTVAAVWPERLPRAR